MKRKKFFIIQVIFFLIGIILVISQTLKPSFSFPYIKQLTYGTLIIAGILAAIDIIMYVVGGITHLFKKDKSKNKSSDDNINDDARQQYNYDEQPVESDREMNTETENFVGDTNQIEYTLVKFHGDKLFIPEKRARITK